MFSHFAFLAQAHRQSTTPSHYRTRQQMRSVNLLLASAFAIIAFVIPSTSAVAQESHLRIRVRARDPVASPFTSYGDKCNGLANALKQGTVVYLCAKSSYGKSDYYYQVASGKTAAECNCGSLTKEVLQSFKYTYAADRAVDKCVGAKKASYESLMTLYGDKNVKCTRVVGGLD